MNRIVQTSIVESKWTGDKESIIELHEKYARAAAAKGAQDTCFQELLYGSYSCPAQGTEYYDYAKTIPERSATQRFMTLAKELTTVPDLHVSEQKNPEFLYSTAASIDADRSLIGE